MSAAAAVALNPVLVSINVNNGRRKRRDAGEEDEDLLNMLTPEVSEKIEELQASGLFVSTRDSKCNFPFLFASSLGSRGLPGESSQQ